MRVCVIKPDTASSCRHPHHRAGRYGRCSPQGFSHAAGSARSSFPVTAPEVALPQPLTGWRRPAWTWQEPSRPRKVCRMSSAGHSGPLRAPRGSLSRQHRCNSIVKENTPGGQEFGAALVIAYSGPASCSTCGQHMDVQSEGRAGRKSKQKLMGPNQGSFSIHGHLQSPESQQ